MFQVSLQSEQPCAIADDLLRGDAVRRENTEVERAFMDGISWLSREEIAAFDVEVFPVELPELLAWLSDGWDGTVRLLGDNAG